MSMYERLKERQVGLGVCKDEPGRASIATNGQPAAAECLNSDQVRDRARLDLVSTRQNSTEGATGLANVLSAQTLWSTGRCSGEG